MFVVGAAVAFGAAGGKRETTTSPSTTVPAAAKVWLCHHTGSWKLPYHLIHVSGDAVPTHLRHGDAQPGTGNSCPTKSAGAKQHAKGDGASARGKSAEAKEKHANKVKSTDDDGDGGDDDGETTRTTKS